MAERHPESILVEQHGRLVTEVLDPIDGTKGLVTGQGYAVGLALLVHGKPLIGALGNPKAVSTPPIMVAVAGEGLRWWPATGPGPVAFEPPQPAWATRSFAYPAPGAREVVDYPPWLLSPQSTACRPFGRQATPSELCCGSLVKYFAVAAQSHCGYAPWMSLTTCKAAPRCSTRSS